MSRDGTLATANWVLATLVFVVAFALFVVNAWAWVTCAPQHGSWAPWSGRVCSGELLPR